ncbi:MAG: hypothetical protein NZ604_06615 [Flavobacteriales bacterium]|nr:hypothetical protein [Flavobacteriales bacterium]
MAANKYIALVAGKLKEILGTVTSTGVANADEIIALDATGKIDPSLLPAGFGAEVVSAVTSENLISGEFVNMYLNGGVATLRKADATDTTKPAYGFVIAGSTSPSINTMYILGVQNDYVSGLTIGTRYFLDSTAGGITSTPLSTTGNLNQEIGIAITATSILTLNSESSTVEIC